MVLQPIDRYKKKEAWAAMPRLKKKVVGLPLYADVE